MVLRKYIIPPLRPTFSSTIIEYTMVVKGATDQSTFVL